MKNSKLNIILVFTAIIPVVILMWPFAWWGDAMSFILRIIPSLSVQLLFCNMAKNSFAKAAPLILTAFAALWGTYLFFTSAHWGNATFGGLVADYISPFICCAVVWLAHRFKQKS